mgnify:CR=1 FL=1
MAKAADKIKGSTRKSYGKITGTHLARAKEQGYTLTPKGLADYMTKLANSGTITKSSWYKLRCAIASTQDYGGYKDAADRLRALKFPEKATPKAKPRRAKIITDQDFKTLRDTVADPTLTADDQSGNFAILDIIAALKFVQGNIGAFGGNARNVTLSGQSAGAINVLAVMTAPNQRTAGLFHRMAPLSGGISLGTSPGFPQPVNDLKGNNGYIPALNPVATYEALSSALLVKLLIDDGSATDVASATAWIQGHSNADIAAYLRGKPASTLLKVGVRTIGGIANSTGSGPIPEGTVVATDPIAAILAGNYVKTPLLAGMTNAEGKLLSSFLPLVGYPAGIKLTDAQLFQTLFDPAKAKAATFGDIINPAYANGAAYDPAIAALDAKFFGALRDNMLNAFITQTPNQVWTYRFDWKQEAAPWNDVYGAAHAFDVPFILGNFGPSLYANVIVTDANQGGREALSGAMMGALAAFARSGDPNDASLGTTWPNWPRVLLFDASATAKRISVQ